MVLVIRIGLRQRAVDLEGMLAEARIELQAGRLTIIATDMMAQPRSKVFFLPSLSIINISIIVHPIFNVLSIPLAIKLRSFDNPSARNTVGR
jgi:hypothetical protein